MRHLQSLLPVRLAEGMRITELLVTGYDGDKVVFTTDLTPVSAATILTGTDDDGETVVEAVSNESTRAFGSMVRTLTKLTESARIGA